MAALIISCLSQKGGVGKSTLARLIAQTYAAGDWSVKIADFNTTQLTSVKWGDIREAAQLKPEIATEPYSQPTRLKRENFDLVVVDGRPDSDQSSLDVARLSTLVIIPTGISRDDLEPQLLFARELAAKGVDSNRILFVLNKTVESAVTVEAARAFLDEFEVATHDLLQRISYQHSQNQGRAITEVAAHVGNLVNQARGVAMEIVEKVTKLTEVTP